VKLQEKYMNRCIQLAKNGLGTTYPNPLVGSAIVYHERIIGEGWHQKAGKPHAEVLAIESVVDTSLLPEATLYVNLEPCSHFGKTPPCADLIIEKGIKKVVVGTSDPNPKVAGRGIQRLRDAGCEVTVGVLESQCEALNKRFFTFQQQQRPYILLKWAQTKDGLIAPSDTLRTSQAPVWITQQTARQHVHKIRAQEEAILVGTHTVHKDNPSLTTRHWQGDNPKRFIIDRNASIPKDAAVFNDDTQVVVFTEQEISNTKDVTYISLDFSEALPTQMMSAMFERGIQSVLVEGGAHTLQHFINDGIWDEALVYEGSVSFSEGVAAPAFNGKKITTKTLGNDILHHYKNPNS
tara:strand:+ start:1367 stop:2416 length:1050 start_codon:yes stop_codon:yes gene_type:complete